MHVPRPKTWHLMIAVAAIALGIQAGRWRRATAHYLDLAEREEGVMSRYMGEIDRWGAFARAARAEVARLRALPPSPDAAALLGRAEDAIRLAALARERIGVKLAQHSHLKHAYRYVAACPWKGLDDESYRYLGDRSPEPPPSPRMFGPPP